ncbi:phage Gp37/Gp68 family protein [Zongyangia hominis]|uniref:DUF5131 family protein n=1 Tax=Zongyangia hominis TaxID=2763677 RepID=A0A926E9E2_9FIRM|nr:phage Gp37/Gp68 family protein [Zongyangia hominis]MBC8570335.1 DUF5131 family protein [Zongyangia hominis]
MAQWNPWHGCHKLSPGCRHCYVYRMDAHYNRDSSVVTQTSSSRLPIQRKKNGEYKIPPGEMVYTCFSSDFFVEDADEWRAEAWRMMREREDLHFLMITKRIDRLADCIPEDWGDGYPNVTICCTVENQDRADYRLPLYRAAPIRHKIIVCEPLLERVNLRPYLGDWVEELVAGGESGSDARPCDFDWILDLRGQCIQHEIPFHFKQTGARLIKDGRLYRIRREYQHSQAKKAGIDYPYPMSTKAIGDKDRKRRGDT